MKRWLFLFLLVQGGLCMAQERLFSVGYGKTLVAKDSATLTISLDVNRIPGKPEQGGGYTLLNQNFGSSRWGYYLMPMADVNLGTAVASAPNNITVGLPFGVVYDVDDKLLEFHLEAAPELVADKGFNNNLYYVNVGAYLRFANKKGASGNVFNLVTGVFNANGTRHQRGIGGRSYGRLTLPAHVKTAFWGDSSRYYQKNFNRLSWTNTLKLNHIYADNKVLVPKRNYIFFSSKVDFYLNPKLALNFAYFNGHEEPVFKLNNAFSFGIAFAR